MTIQNNLFAETSAFINNHKLLCGLTLGIAIVVYAIGNLAGRAVAWIKECCQTTQKIDAVARQVLASSNGSSASVTSVEVLPASPADRIRTSFDAFIKEELEKEILPFYEEHEKGFDGARIHGRMHVARAVIFGEVMARYYQSKGEAVDFDYVRRTIGLHDAGRKDNGIDYWEKESSELLYKHLIAKNTPEAEARQKSRIIIKDEADQKSIAFKIFQSADCLDIMRPCTGRGGRKGFDPAYLTFLSGPGRSPEEAQFRQKLIDEAWFFIQQTEKLKMTADFSKSSGFMQKLFDVISQHRDQLPLLSSIVKKTSAV